MGDKKCGTKRGILWYRNYGNSENAQVLDTRNDQFLIIKNLSLMKWLYFQQFYFILFEGYAYENCEI